MSKEHEQKFWGANRTAAQRIARVPDLTEREVRYALALNPDAELLAALEVRNGQLIYQRAHASAMALLLQGSPLQQVRDSLGLIIAAMADDDFPKELKTRGQGIWLELRGLEEKFTKHTGGKS